MKLPESAPPVTWYDSGWWGRGWLISLHKKHAKILLPSGRISKTPIDALAWGWVSLYDELSCHFRRYPMTGYNPFGEKKVPSKILRINDRVRSNKPTKARI